MANIEQMITNENIINTIKENGFIIIYEKDGVIRKQLHKFAKFKGYFHVSYIDKTKNYDKDLRYWCESCERFLIEGEYASTHSNLCSGTEFFIYCSRCYDEDDLCDRVIVSKEGYMYDEGYHTPKWVKKNNMIAISNNIQFLKDIFDKKNKKKPINWMKNK